jgi:PKD repeat protein
MDMRNRVYPIMVVVLLVAALFSASSSQAGPPVEDAAPPVRLLAGTFTPARGESLEIPPGLTIAAYAAGQRGYYIVQFDGPVEQAWKDRAIAMGADLLGYIPDFAFKVRMTPAQARGVERLGSVAWVGLFQPAYKLSPNLARDGTHFYTVRVERGADAGLATAAIARTGAQILAREDKILLVAADSSQLNAVAQVLDVAWVENFLLRERHNEYGGGVIMGANTANTNGYDGSTQTVAVADTGLGDGTASGAHPDIPASRISAIYNWKGKNSGGCYKVKGDGPQDVDSGHGTHVSGSVLGAGGDSGEAKGTAPAANLVFQATEDYVEFYGLCEGVYPDGYYLMGLPDDIRDLFQQAYDAGARIHSDSWGSDVDGDYTLDSANTDDFVWNHPDMAILTSAGNEGIDANGDGLVDSDSTGSPATAKNLVTVGASENDRQGSYPCDTSLTYTSHDAYQPGETCSSMKGNNLLGTYGQRYPSEFPADPVASDVTAGNQEQMAAWSSRGPTDDGRIKPDVVAPGTWILSNYSGLYQEGYGDPTNPQNGLYQWDGWGMPFGEPHKYMGGTSMSTPLTAGGAAVIRDFYDKAHSHSASAALVKATLINSAVDMLDENNDGADDNDYPIPNDHEGWGRVDLAAATDGSHQFVDEAAGLATGGSATYSYGVESSGGFFKVTLVWSDYPSTEAASQNLVNDLDLVVTSPSNTVYRGNVFSGGWSASGGSEDRTNNVENVYVQSAEIGAWTVEVSGYNVPDGPQPYALVIDGGSVGDTPPSVSIVDPIEGQTIEGTYHVLVSASDDSAVTLVELSIDGGTYTDITANFDGTYYFYDWDTIGSADGAHTLQARATDDAAQTTDSTIVNVTVDNINDPPVATFTYSCSGLTCDFDASASYDPDGSITDYDWDFGDTNTGSGVTPSHTYGAEGTYTVVLTVTDNDGAWDTDSQDVTVSEGVGMYVWDISFRETGPHLKATVTIRFDSDGDGVAEETDDVVSGATVDFTLTHESSQSQSYTGTTDSNGQVEFQWRRAPSGSYTAEVTGLFHTSYTWDPTLDVDNPDTYTKQ